MLVEWQKAMISERPAGASQKKGSISTSKDIASDKDSHYTLALED